MDIDVGKIDRIKIWHDNTGAGSAWFLDSVTIRKKYSTCSMISNIYIQRLEQISQVFYRQNSNDDHGNNRSILRSPIMSDRISLQKKVTWDEHSIGSQDDLFSKDSAHLSTTKQSTGHFEHRAHWISSHSLTYDHQWQIQSIEETNSFDLDQSTRALLLSDRSKVKSSNDEIYEFQANRWLAKDKEDGKTEVSLTGKLTHQSSNSTHSLKPKEDSKMSTHSNVTFTQQHDEPLDTRLKSSRNLRHRLDSMNSEHPPTKLLQQKKDSLSQLTGNDRLLTPRITSESSTSSMLKPLSQRIRSSHVLSNNASNREQDSLNKLPLQTIQLRQEQSRNSLIYKSSPRLITNPIEPSIKSKSFVRSNPLLSTNKSISSMFDYFLLPILFFSSSSDRTDKSTYEIQSMDDF